MLLSCSVVFSLARFRYLFFFSLSFNFTLWSAGTAKSTILQVLFFLLIVTRYGRLAEIRWSVCITKSQRSYYYYYYYYYSLIRAFHISDSRWFFTEVWVTASLLKSPGLFLVFWQFSTMLSFGWTPLVRQPPSPLVPLVIP